MPIKQTVIVNAFAQKIYDALTNEATFATMTGAPAEISGNEGGAFSCFGGQVTGRYLELSPNHRIVQAWRVGPWPEGVYSIVKLELSETDGATTIHLEHNGYPEEMTEHLEGGWHKMYWEPLKAHVE